MIYLAAGILIFFIIKLFFDSKITQQENNQLLQNLEKLEKNNDRKK
tara:strand:+ start:347 stop:484 length:138 start_codon:yes stop_codon:yes gene_type:complete